MTIETANLPTVFYCNAGEHMVEYNHTGIGTGFATNADNTYRTCYECCARVDAERMKAEGNSKMAALYLTMEDVSATEWRWVVTNWPGTLRFPILRSTTQVVRAGCCGMLKRRDVWFQGPDGYVWHGFNQGDNQIVHCKRTKGKV